MSEEATDPEPTERHRIGWEAWTIMPRCCLEDLSCNLTRRRCGRGGLFGGFLKQKNIIENENREK